MSYRVTVIQEKRRGKPPIFTASYDQMPRCSFSAGSKEEAVDGLERIRDPYIRSLRARGLPVPPSSTATSNRPCFYRYSKGGLQEEVTVTSRSDSLGGLMAPPFQLVSG